MKRLIFLVCFVQLFVTTYSQDQVTNEQLKIKNEIGISSNISILELSHHQYQVDIVKEHGKAVFSYGLSYIRTISQRLKIETEIFYGKYAIVYRVVNEPYGYFDATENFKIISIPILLRCYFPKDYYLSGGTILDFSFSKGPFRISDYQNGFGLSIGAGKEISLGRFSLSIATNFDLLAVIPFSGDLSQQKFFVPGFKIGLNYKI